jgi:hypothetical protein
MKPATGGRILDVYSFVTGFEILSMIPLKIASHIAVFIVETIINK